jgi:hypothetical protein
VEPGAGGVEPGAGLAYGFCGGAGGVEPGAGLAYGLSGVDEEAHGDSWPGAGGTGGALDAAPSSDPGAWGTCWVCEVSTGRVCSGDEADSSVPLVESAQGSLGAVGSRNSGLSSFRGVSLMAVLRRGGVTGAQI